MASKTDREEPGRDTSPAPRTGAVSALAVANVVTAALCLLAGLASLSERGTHVAGFNFQALADLVGGALLILAVLLVVAGVGVWQRRAWGRILSIVLALAPAMSGIGLISLGGGDRAYALPLFVCAAAPLVVLFQRRFAAEFVRGRVSA